jgi:hypothetical protein
VGVILLWVWVFPRRSLNTILAAQGRAHARNNTEEPQPQIWKGPPHPFWCPRAGASTAGGGPPGGQGAEFGAQERRRCRIGAHPSPTGRF